MVESADGRREGNERNTCRWWLPRGELDDDYQVAFATRQACEIALSELRNDARRLGAFGDTVRTPAGAPAMGGAIRSDGSAAPTLSAVCVNQR